MSGRDAPLRGHLGGDGLRFCARRLAVPERAVALGRAEEQVPIVVEEKHGAAVDAQPLGDDARRPVEDAGQRVRLLHDVEQVHGEGHGSI